MLLRKLAEQVLNRDEFAPGIPSSKQIHSIPRVHHEKPEVWHISTQIHDADVAGRHLDLRLVDPNGLAHSWAVPAAKLPGPGEKVLAIQQPTHCFPPGTLVATPKGNERIEDIQVGDLVFSANKDGLRVCREVTNTLRGYSTGLVSFHARLGKHGGTIISTPGHQIYTSTGKKDAADLTVTDTPAFVGKRLSGDQMSIVIGTLLGDGNWNRSQGLRVCHGAKQQRYAKYKAKVLETKAREDKHGKWWFHLCGPQVAAVGRVIGSGIKEVSEGLLDQMGVRGLAILFCDDGSCWISHNRIAIEFSTQSWSDKSIGVFCKWLNERHGIKACVYSCTHDTRWNETAPSNKKLYRVRIASIESVERFLHLVAPYVPACMSRKVPKHDSIKRRRCRKCSQATILSRKYCSSCLWKDAARSNPGAYNRLSDSLVWGHAIYLRFGSWPTGKYVGDAEPVKFAFLDQLSCSKLEQVKKSDIGIVSGYVRRIPKGKKYTGVVYNLTVAIDHNYVLACGLVVGNSKEYAARQGTFQIEEGYGKGTVQSSGLIPVEVVRSQPGHIRFNTYGGNKEGVQEYNLIETPKGTLLHNITSTAESGVRGMGGYPIPNAKPGYREIQTSEVKFDDPNEIHQAKLDGAHCFTWETQIETLEYGRLPISLIVHKKLEVTVESGLGVTGETLWKPVTRWYQRPAPKSMRHVKIAACPTRKLKVTDDHKVKTPTGECSAADLRVNDLVLTSQPTLSASLLQAVRGMLMGDSSLSLGTNFYRLAFAHGLPQSEYCWAKYWLLEEFCGTEPKESVFDGYVEGGKRVRSQTRCNPTFTPLHEEFYLDRKRVTRELLDKLDDISLAFWFMDDGHVTVADNEYGDNRQLVLGLHTEGFTSDENALIVEWFRDRGIHARVNTDAKGYNFVAMGAEAAMEFLRRTAPWIYPSMRYKLGETYYKFDHIILDSLGSRWSEIDSKPVRVLWPCPVISNRPYSKPDDNHYNYVYNLEVADTHTYMACGVLVGNCTIHLREDRPIKVFSYRPTERASGVLEHTHKLPDYRELKAPPGLAGTVLRGELVGVDKSTGKALPAETTGGLLNATVWNSREKQEAIGAELRPAIFDVVRYKGKLMEQAPYAEKLKVLEEVQSKVPRLAIPPMARSADEKVDLFSQIQSGKHPLTNEGVVVWKLDSPRPTKAKFRPDVDAEVVGVTPGQGKHTGRVGALRVRLPGREAITNVGTGLSDALRDQIAKDPSAFIGRVAKVRTQQVFPSGRLRAPSFSEWHIDKGKQAQIRKLAATVLMPPMPQAAHQQWNAMQAAAGPAPSQATVQAMRPVQQKTQKILERTPYLGGHGDIPQHLIADLPENTPYEQARAVAQPRRMKELGKLDKRLQTAGSWFRQTPEAASRVGALSAGPTSMKPATPARIVVNPVGRTIATPITSVLGHAPTQLASMGTRAGARSVGTGVGTVAGKLLRKIAGDTLDIEAYITGPSGAGKTTYVKEHYPSDKFFILHSDKYADKNKDGTVTINWEKALEDGVMSGKPIVVDAYQANPGLMRLARNKILLDPGKVKTLGQMIGRRKASLRNWKYAPEEKLERFNSRTRPVAKELGFQEKVAFTIPGHIDLTDQALDALKNKGIEFTPGQQHRLEEANAGVDRESEKGLLVSNKHQPFHYHTGDAAAAKYLIKKYFNEAVHSDTTSKALDALGIALHTTQDRWAHEVNKIKPGIRGLIAHIPFLGPKPDSIEDHPTYARKAVEDSKRLISRFVNKVHDLGKVNNQPQYFKAVLTPEEQEKFKLSSGMRTLASQALKERK